MTPKIKHVIPVRKGIWISVPNKLTSFATQTANHENNGRRSQIVIMPQKIPFTTSRLIAIIATVIKTIAMQQNRDATLIAT